MMGDVVGTSVYQEDYCVDAFAIKYDDTFVHEFGIVISLMFLLTSLGA
jgi:hypothetical protein